MHVRELRANHRCERTVFALDSREPVFRRELCPGYKAQRRRTPPRLREQLQQLDSALAEIGGAVHRVVGFEADDILATLAARLRAQGDSGLVVSCDSDLLALAHGGVEVLLLGQSAGEGARYDSDAVRRRCGVDAAALVHYRALKGAKADGVPGVPDLHPRDAARLVREHGTVESLLANLASVRPPTLRRLLSQHVEHIRHNARLLALREDVPLDE